jgi:sulfoxide reductase catalytic subunit YedY
MLIRKPPEINASEITDESVYRSRREIVKAMGLGAAALAIPGVASGNVPLRSVPGVSVSGPDWLKTQIGAAMPSDFSTTGQATPWDVVTRYNNFYEFGSGKDDPFDNAGKLTTDPWTVEVSGEAEVTGKVGLDDLLGGIDLEERVYRFRCVEAWSMVIPWIGFPLASLIKRFKPLSSARYVRFETLYRPSEMPGQRSRFSSIDWPYIEGLRMDEAMNPLTLLAVGVYGNVMPNQNGAPLRLVVPWKYGFKSIKSIVKIEFTRTRPKTTWEIANSREYGFYSNVNPSVPHPRWSQASERRLPQPIFGGEKIKTRIFNGYGAQVAQMYADMDLRRDF